MNKTSPSIRRNDEPTIGSACWGILPWKKQGLKIWGGKDFWPEYLPFHSIGPTNIDSKIYKLTLNAFSSRPRFLTKLYKTSNVIRFCNELSGPIEQNTNFEYRTIFWLAYHIVWKLIEYRLHCIFLTSPSISIRFNVIQVIVYTCMT